MRHMNQRESRTAVIADRLTEPIRREIPSLLITAPIVVPIWWALWKVCDSLWLMR